MSPLVPTSAGDTRTSASVLDRIQSRLAGRQESVSQPQRPQRQQDVEEYSTLQTSATRNIEGATSNNHEHPKVHLDFGPAGSAIEWLDVHFTLPTFDIEAVLGEQAHWLPQCLDWIRGDWYSWDGPFDCVRIYYDGSFHPKSGSAGSASAAFVRQDGVWKFAGALSVQ